MATETESKETTKQIVCEPAIIEAPKMSSWNDDRLDELSARTDKGFTDVRLEMRDGFAQVDKRFEKVDQEFKAVRLEMSEGFVQVHSELHRLTNALIIAGISGVITVLGGLLTAIFVTGILG
jgi:hypothetical protein